MALSGQPATGRVRFPGLDGLRAFAVAAVLLYHAGDLWSRPPLPGGFLGVDVFFVLSGFLITSILLDTHARDGGVAATAFWARRGLRLLPALLTAVAVTLALIVMFDPTAVSAVRGDALAGALQVANWRFIVDAQGYFEQFGRPSPFRHLWSLSIEWQFYLAWPLVLGAMLRVMSRRAVGALVLATAVAAPIAAGALFAAGVDASRLYYGTDTHAGGLLAGAALAFVLSMRPARATERTLRVFEWAGPTAIIALVPLMLTLGVRGAFLGGFGAVSALTVIAIASIVSAPARWQAPLHAAPMQWLGTRSYAIYLVHWPVFVYTRPDADIALDSFALLALRLAITFALAEVLHRIVERPFMHGSPLPRLASRPRLRRAGAIGLATIAATSVGAIAIAAIAADAPAAKPTLVRDAAFAAAPRLASVAVTTEPTIVWIAAAPSATVAPVRPSPVAVSPIPSASARAAERGGTSSVSSVKPVEPAPALGTLTPVTGVRVTAIGDSVMLGATSALRAAVAQIDIYAEVGIQTSAGVLAIEQARTNGTLGDVVLVHLGNNGLFRAYELDAIMTAAGDRRVVVVNDNVPRDWEKANNSMLTANIGRYANATLVDWHAASDGQRAYFVDDGVHLTGPGAAAYVALIADAIAP